ncbi:MAG TPA: helix-turn-helix domain-containing protein [Actinomycetota bacterium]|nr:helix-turn-helix domain-containing protein [Actinomycetota bacterium]
MTDLSSTATRWYRSAGLLIESEIALDELAVRAEPGPRDVAITRVDAATVEDVLSRAVQSARVGSTDDLWLEVHRATDAYVMRWSGTLDVVIPDAGDALLVCENGDTNDSVPRLLLCQAMSFLLSAHEREGLHASAVEIDGRAIVITGDSGRGKSTLATALTLAGGTLLADDLVVVSVDDQGVPLVHPTTTKTWLAPALAEALMGRNGFERLRPEKVAVGGDGIAHGTKAVPMAAMVFVRYRDDAPEVSEPMESQEALWGFLGACFNLSVRTPERAQMQFDIATRVAQRVPVHVLRWKPAPDTAVDGARTLLQGLAIEIPSFGGTSMESTVETNGNGARKLSSRHEIVEMLRAAGVEDLPDDGYDEPLLRTSQVAALLRSSDRTVRTWADAGKLPYIKTLGGRRLFPVSGILQVLQTMQRHTEEA